jgi:hypothetical protein
VFSQRTPHGDHRDMSITTGIPTPLRADPWRELGQQLRVAAIRATAVSGSGGIDAEATVGAVDTLLGAQPW